MRNIARTAETRHKTQAGNELQTGATGSREPSRKSRGYLVVPTYSYECTQCGHVEDKFHSMTAKPRVKCEECGGRCIRLIGKGSGIIFKGSGFYETDYKDKKGTPPSKAKQAKDDGKGGESKSESSSESKSESKPKTEKKKTEKAMGAEKK